MGFSLLESIRISAVLLSAFLPTTAQKIFEQLNTNETSYNSINNFDGMKKTTKVGNPEPLFVRINKDDKLKEIDEYFSKNK